eukprot:g2008.t1
MSNFSPTPSPSSFIENSIALSRAILGPSSESKRNQRRGLLTEAEAWAAVEEVTAQQRARLLQNAQEALWNEEKDTGVQTFNEKLPDVLPIRFPDTVTRTDITSNMKSSTSTTSLKSFLSLSEMHEGKAEIVKFLQEHRCYDVLPESSKVITLDTRVSLRLAFYALVENSVHSAPLWDHELCRPVGIFTSTDFIHIILHFSKSSDSITDGLSNHNIKWWLKVRRAGLKKLIRKGEEKSSEFYRLLRFRDILLRGEMISVGVEESLLRACQLLMRHKIHRLPTVVKEADATAARLMDIETNLNPNAAVEPGQLLGIITHLSLLKYLVAHFREGRKLFETSVFDLGMGSYGENVITVSEDTTLFDVIRKLANSHISGLPIVNKDKKVTDMYCRTDVIHLTSVCGSFKERLSHSIKEELAILNDVQSKGVTRRERLVTCSKNTSLHSIIEMFAGYCVHRIVTVDEKGSCNGVVSLTDLVSWILTKE